MTADGWAAIVFVPACDESFRDAACVRAFFSPVMFSSCMFLSGFVCIWLWVGVGVLVG